MADNFKILSQRPSSELTPDGRFVDVMEVTFETRPHAQVGTTSIPASVYTADEVRRVVGELAQTMIDVAEL